MENNFTKMRMKKWQIIEMFSQYDVKLCEA